VTAPASGPRGIDHLVLAVADLDAAAARYEAMGFTVGRRNRHPWGTENRIIQLSGCFIELIAAGEGRSSPPTSGHFDFGFFVRRFLSRHGEGFAMLALESRDAEADRATFDAAGIGGFEPFAFERRARAADGCETRVAFSLAFAASPAIPEAGFFTCRHETPDAFWNEALQRHANSADQIGRAHV